MTGHQARPHMERDLRDFAKLGEGETGQHVLERGEKLEHPYNKKIFKDRYTRQHRNRLCSTITAHLSKDGLMFIHPTQNRSLTPREAARIQSFPDGFHFSVPRTHQYRLIGNAVPPLLGKSIGASIKKISNCRLNLVMCEEIPPSPRRLIESMRSVGYSFEDAVADILDNSIRAGATKITIQSSFPPSKPYLLIADNGKGMTQDELKEAMRFGSEVDYEESSLGKFGLGLKTSSLSQCRSFQVASRSYHEGSRIYLVAWDFDHVKKTNKWEVPSPSKEDQYSKLCCGHLKESHGTVVLWRELDTVFQRLQNKEGKHAKNALLSKCRKTEEHLAMVFHRFLSDKHGGQPIEIIFNNNKIQPWDPFALDYAGKAKTWKVTRESFEVIPNEPEVI